jgi:hypothetical protein
LNAERCLSGPRGFSNRQSSSVERQGGVDIAEGVGNSGPKADGPVDPVHFEPEVVIVEIPDELGQAPGLRKCPREFGLRFPGPREGVEQFRKCSDSPAVQDLTCGVPGDPPGEVLFADPAEF